MANSEFEYVRKHEQWDGLAPDNWIVVRIDGRGFSKFSKRHEFTKPNDRRAIDLMNAAAQEVVRQLVDIVIAYGQSDEYSFVLHQNTQLFDRRAFKLATTIATTFSVEYASQWSQFFPDTPLTRPFPTFDGRTVLYPKRKILRDYLSWRQADCHINNLYNTTFWAHIQQGGMTAQEAEDALKGTYANDKNEILFSRFGINYNNEDAVYRKGTVIYRHYADQESQAADDAAPTIDVVKASEEAVSATPDSVHDASLSATKIFMSSSSGKPMSRTKADKERKRKMKAEVKAEHVDIIRDQFWQIHPWILET